MFGARVFRIGNEVSRVQFDGRTVCFLILILILLLFRAASFLSVRFVGPPALSPIY